MKKSAIIVSYINGKFNSEITFINKMRYEIKQKNENDFDVLLYHMKNGQNEKILDNNKQTQELKDKKRFRKQKQRIRR